ncbi:hypothetical protein MMC07_004463 [Pseudocyphellaria aurata]|nr:hypothetical protein [Pseudocyphellaria aurata]
MPPSKDTRRRHSKPSPQSKALSPPSTLSVLSSSTSGSNSTVTYDRPFRSSLRPSKRFDAKKPVANESGPAVGVRKGSNGHHSDKENLPVFAYMEKAGQEVDSDDEEEEEENREEEKDGEEEEDAIEDVVDEEVSTTSSSPHVASLPEATKIKAAEVNAGGAEEQAAWRKEAKREGSLHSDSGISVRSSSPERESPVPRHKYPPVRRVSASTGNGPNPAYSSHHPLMNSPETHGPRCSPYPRDWSTSGNHMEHPEMFYASTRPVVMQTMQRARIAPPENYGQHTRQLVRAASRSQTPAAKPKKPGYDTLAAAIDARGDSFLKPIYRKFETLNNRFLLYLQDEIGEMEGDLRELDNAIAREDEMMGKTHASRRAEAKLPSQLQWRRLDLLGRSHTKVEQYYRALSSYSNLTKSLDPASEADINAYREWIAEHAPIVEQEAAFLQNEADLITVAPEKSNSSTLMQSHSHGQLEAPVIMVAFTLVSTIIVFKVVPQILARLVISAVVGVAWLCTLSPSILSDPKSIRTRGRGISIYTAVMFVLAIVVG